MLCVKIKVIHYERRDKVVGMIVALKGNLQKTKTLLKQGEIHKLN